MERIEFVGGVSVMNHSPDDLMPLPRELVLQSPNADGSGNFPNLKSEHFDFSRVRLLYIGRPDEQETERIIALMVGLKEIRSLHAWNLQTLHACHRTLYQGELRLTSLEIDINLPTNPPQALSFVQLTALKLT